MKNLKRALSFALASVMLIGMMVVGAGAAEFTDADKIVNEEAVQTMVALGVLAGKEDGSWFDPTGTITREEMSKVIAVMLNGGKDITGVTKPTPTFSDIDGNWAEGYIEYCYNLGIIAGRGDGTFDPKAVVTGTEAAKMFLVALGYDADVFEFTGNSWAISVNSKANEVDLYDGIEHIDPSAGLTRDNAAQMAYNTLEAFMMEKSYDKVLSSGEISYNYVLSDDTTFLNEKFDGKIFIGTFDGNTDTLGLASAGHIQATGCLDTQDPIQVSNTANFPSDLDISNIGEEIKVIFKDGKSGTRNVPDKNDTIFGVFNTGNTQVIWATRNDVKSGASAATANNKVKIGSTEYKIATKSSGTLVQVDYADNHNSNATYNNNTTVGNVKAAFEGLSVSQNGSKVKFVCDDNGNIVTAYVVNEVITYVTAVSATKITLAGVGSINIADNDIYDAPAKDDIVTYTRYYDATDKDEAYFTVKLAETVTGELTGYKNSTDNIVLDGTTYRVLQKSLSAISIGNETTEAGFTGDDIGESFTAYMVGGYVGYVIQASDAANKVALVIDVNTGKLGSTFDTPKAQLLLADGNKVTVSLHKDSIIYPDANNSATYTNDGTQLVNDGTAAISAVSNNAHDAANSALQIGQIVRYAEMSSGEYKIVEVKTGATGTYNNVYTTVGQNDVNANDPSQNKTLYDEDLKAFNGVVTAGDAVLFVKQTETVNNVQTTEYKAYNVRSLNDVKAVQQNDNYGYMTKDGKVIAGYVELGGRPSGASGSMFYGVVSAYVGIVDEAGDTYRKYTVESGDDVYTVLLDENSSHIAAGDLVGFEPTSDNIYNDADIKVYTGSAYDATNGLATWIKEYSEADQTLTYWTTVSGNPTAGFTGNGTTTRAIDEDCFIAYVNMDDSKGGDSIGVNPFDNANNYRNVLLVKNDSDAKVVAIFVETSGNVDIMPSTPVNIPQGADDDGIKALADGTYVPGDTTFANDLGSATASDIMIFKFTTVTAGTQQDPNPATLTIKGTYNNTANTEVYTETGTNWSETLGDHYFYIDIDTTNTSGSNAGTGHYANTSFPAGTYTYTIVDADNVTLLSGSFTI